MESLIKTLNKTLRHFSTLVQENAPNSSLKMGRARTFTLEAQVETK